MNIKTITGQRASFYLSSCDEGWVLSGAAIAHPDAEEDTIQIVLGGYQNNAALKVGLLQREDGWLPLRVYVDDENNISKVAHSIDWKESKFICQPATDHNLAELLSSYMDAMVQILDNNIGALEDLSDEHRMDMLINSIAKHLCISPRLEQEMRIRIIAKETASR